jgi:hypothetical protein
MLTIWQRFAMPRYPFFYYAGNGSDRANPVTPADPYGVTRFPEGGSTLTSFRIFGNLVRNAI